MNKFDFSDKLKMCGLKSTKHRIVILDILEKSNQPIAAEQVFQIMRDKDIVVNLSTVYRALDTLCEKKLVIKLNIYGDSRALFEFNRMLHTHHLICLNCKKIIVIDRCPLEEYEKTLAKETDYLIEGHKLVVYGYCPQCREKQLKKGLV